jgi:hypothetical protein
MIGNIFERDENAVLLKELTDKGTVFGIDPGFERRLKIFETRGAGEIPGEILVNTHERTKQEDPQDEGDLCGQRESSLFHRLTSPRLGGAKALPTLKNV